MWHPVRADDYSQPGAHCSSRPGQQRAAASQGAEARETSLLGLGAVCYTLSCVPCTADNSGSRFPSCFFK